ncbi:response regulator [Dyadobacter sp. CY107]|uniref:response regulator n=1 Tax=Dyadobacter fanqingshengii TaxID=2906443 RepID=UPI001F27C4A3|nr:response regulator [Dyadobacter fanqingshengii]MCF2506826.1 response regulator [Dyadobacter fanqingshengii]
MGNKGLFVMIDGDIDDQEIFKMAIGDLNSPVECLFFQDCESAVAHFSHKSVTPPGYVFIDICLPRINGDECLLQLKQLQEFDHPYIIIYSTSIPDQWKPRLEQIGVNRFISKMGSVPALVDEIKHLIDA